MKYKHENPNIEIINSNLWAVRFSLIPMIPQISYKPDPATPTEDIPAELAPNGVILLNKDFKHYSLMRKGVPAVMKLNPRQLKKEIALNPIKSAKALNQVIYWTCLQIELERRKVKNGGDT